jgi:restriction endonuclease S subunit
MYVVYEEHIETLEAENEELKKEVLVLKQRLKYYSIDLDNDISDDI